MEESTKASSKKILDQVLEFFNGLMVQYMKENGKKGSKTAQVVGETKTESGSKEYGRREKRKIEMIF